MQGSNTPSEINPVTVVTSPKIHKTASSLNHHSASELFDRIVSWDNALDAYHKTQRGHLKHKKDAIIFAKDWSYNLKNLVTKVKDGTYQVGDYHQFYVHDPKTRLIVAPCYEDKIVQHMLNNVLRDLYEPCFIKDSYACIRGRGNKAAVLELQKKMRIGKRNFQNAYIVKADIVKFFYNIDRVILKRIIRKKIKCERTLLLLDSIIDSNEGDVGLHLGNLISQLLANIYLNDIDQLFKRKYKVKHYLRYADDIFMIVDGKDQAKHIAKELSLEMNERLRLSISDRKTRVIPVECGVVGLGYKIYTTHIELKHYAKRKFRIMLSQHKQTKYLVKVLNSWNGFASVAKITNFVLQNLPENIKYHTKFIEA